MKKELKILIIVLICLLLLVGIVYIIDMNRMKNNNPVLFSTWGYDYVPPVYMQDGISLKVLCDLVNSKGENLTWSDFEKYPSTEIGSGLYILLYEVDKNYNLMIGGVPNEKPMYVRLVSKKDDTQYIDVRYENIDNFLTQVQNSFIGTVLEETTTYMIVEPNEDEDERKSADKIQINYGTDNIDYVYGVGRKVLISYSGYIMETYPAQINTNNISADGYSDFEIIVEKSENKTKKKILNNSDLYKNNSNFDLYYYGLDEINVKVDNKTISLKDALKTGKITLTGLISKANQDLEDKKITGDMYKDGGSMIYKYDTYTIIKCHTLDGNRDVYIGIPDMNINDVI